MLRLILPDTRYLDSYIAALREGYNYTSYTPKSEEEIKKIEADPFTHFDDENFQGGTFTPPDGIERPRVPHNKYWLVNDTDFIGSVWVRHILNDFLEKHAGHIGYGIRPSMRRKGYGTKILTMGLDQLKRRGVSRVLVMANDQNIGSVKAILACGGVLESKQEDIFRPGVSGRYWIELKD